MQPTPSDRDAQTTMLLGELRQGREDAYVELFDLYSDQLIKIIRFRLDRRLATRVDPEDVLQEVFLAGQKRIQNLVASPTDSFLIWIRLILRQTIVDLVRHHLGAQRRSANREVRSTRKIYHADESFSMASRLIANTASPSAVFSKKEMISRVEECLEELGDNDREIIALRHYEELGNKEVAEILGIAEKAASIRYVRALAKLKTTLAKITDRDGTHPGFI